MEQTRIYIYDKISGVESVLGQYQLPFNMCLSIDESKDTCKIVALSNRKQYIEPNTIVRLEGFSDLWWVVKKDNVQRHDNDFDFLYEHRISLEGAFEILNARDLTSCGFNTNRYTINEFVERLFKLSDFEYQTTFDGNDVLDYNKIVDYIKTFENYTLASALKEFFNGYNCVPKLKFVKQNGALTRAVLYVVSKMGNNEQALSLENSFDDTNETRNIDNESYATRVISNIQNCVSKKPIRYPDIGACELVGQSGEVTYGNVSQAKILLPSPAYSVESITFYPSVRIDITNSQGTLAPNFFTTPDDNSRKGNKLKGQFVDYLESLGVSQSDIDHFTNDWENYFNELKPHLCFTIRNGGYYDAITGESHGSYQEVFNRGHIAEERYMAKVYLNNARYNYVNDGETHFCIQWKQNSNEITGFEFIENCVKVAGSYGFIFTTFINQEFEMDIQINSNLTLTLNIQLAERYPGAITQSNYLSILDFSLDGWSLGCRTLYSVEYIPMSDLKVKSDNNINYNDSKLYNQNGKLVDGYAVSKLINGYSESVSGGEIAKSRKFYNYDSVFKLGQVFRDFDGKAFVSSNVSIDVYDNENGFVYDVDYTLNVNSSCKSTMISANTSIRDYDCPQENNIKRVQLYRDYVEFSYEKDNNANNSYIGNTYLDFFSLNALGFKNDFCVFVRSTDDSFLNADDNTNNYYYRVPHTLYELSKKTIVNVDFGDNNIIGHGNRQVNKAFALSNIFNNQKVISVPISYVDNRGELDGLEVIFTPIFKAEDYFGDIYISDNCVIAPSLYDACKESNIVEITEDTYNKDGLEVPVFLYSIEVNGDNGIVVAENLLEYGENYDRFVCIVLDNTIITQENQSLLFENATKYTCSINDLRSRTYQVEIANQPFTNLKGKSLGLFAMKNNEPRFIMAFNNYPNEQYVIRFYTNSYKLK